ncbi:MAG: AmmeMemoRadiSam system protein B, partial [Anaerolineaceae bacterium]|nr:AmmeMemoRadiSam system protein B [Anaerolineaceae bacterium]
MEFIATARPSPIAGTWYTKNAAVLSRQIDSFIDQAKIPDGELTDKIIGLVSPHAGYRYSGRTAGYAYKAIKGEKRNLVVIFSPFHQYFPGDLITTSYSAYETPLGKVPVDIESLTKVDRLLKNEGIIINQLDSDPEHSLEIQLPFLQRALNGNFRLLPLMVRGRNPAMLGMLAELMHEVIKNESYLLIASTDLSHFFPLNVAQRMDREMLKHIEDTDPEGVLAAEKEGKAAACGASSVAL